MLSIFEEHTTEGSLTISIYFAASLANLLSQHFWMSKTDLKVFYSFGFLPEVGDKNYIQFHHSLSFEAFDLEMLSNGLQVQTNMWGGDLSYCFLRVGKASLVLASCRYSSFLKSRRVSLTVECRKLRRRTVSF